MAWLRRAPEDAAASSSRRSSSRERCRKQSCATKLNDLKSEIKELESQLKPLQRLFNSEVEGQVRRVHAELAEAITERDDARAAEQLAMRRRNSALKSARDLAEENEQLLSKVAALSSSYASLMGKHASSEKKAKSESRQAAQRERQLRSRLAVAEARASAAEQRAGLKPLIHLHGQLELLALELLDPPRRRRSPLRPAPEPLRAPDPLRARLLRLLERRAARWQPLGPENSRLLGGGRGGRVRVRLERRVGTVGTQQRL